MPVHPLPEIPVVYYHSIGPVNKDWNRRELTLETHFFEDQLRFFKNNFHTIFLKEYYELRTSGRRSIKNPLVITLDDGFLDNWIWAFPLLKKYGLRATIFVCPEFVDQESKPRPNLEDYWNHRAEYRNLFKWGYLNWEEMRLMLKSGLVDIQSHTMSHTKYMVSGKLTGFHHPGNDCLYPVGNLYPSLKPYHIGNPEFEKMIPYGTPLFEEQSSVVARKITIHPEFSLECVDALRKYDFTGYSFKEAYSRVHTLFRSYLDSGKLITSVETDEQRENRIRYEIENSKSTIENALHTKVEFLCWPHGDNDAHTHQLALNAGYLSTTIGNCMHATGGPDRIPQRIGMHHVWNNRVLSRLKAKHKLGRALDRFPYAQIDKVYRLLTNSKAAV